MYIIIGIGIIGYLILGFEHNQYLDAKRLYEEEEARKRKEQEATAQSTSSLPRWLDRFPD